MILIGPPLRKPDSWGSGEYLASRGHRKHMGIDYHCIKGSVVMSNCDGIVSKLGYPYADDLGYRYVQVTTTDEFDYRFFYVDPVVKVGQRIKVGDPLGVVQDLEERYNGITPHFHFEVKKDGKHVDPREHL